MGEAAVRAGCDAYFGYPITPQNELTAYMAKHMLDQKRTFIQAESETSAINMVYGAAATGARAMTSSSSPGVSLKQEGISYACGADVPCVIINVARSGPGLGGISPAQGDYFQSTRGGGHGDYYHIVLAPKSVQEAADLTYKAFDLADKWRMPAMILADGLIGLLLGLLRRLRGLAGLLRCLRGGCWRGRCRVVTATEQAADDGEENEDAKRDQANPQASTTLLGWGRCKGWRALRECAVVGLLLIGRRDAHGEVSLLGMDDFAGLGAPSLQVASHGALTIHGRPGRNVGDLTSHGFGVTGSRVTSLR